MRGLHGGLAGLNEHLFPELVDGMAVRLDLVQSYRVAEAGWRLVQSCSVLHMAKEPVRITRLLA